MCNYQIVLVFFCYAYVSVDLTKNPRKKRLSDHNDKTEFFREGRNFHDRLRQLIFYLLMKNHWIELKCCNVMEFVTNAEFIILWNIWLNNFSSILIFTNEFSINHINFYYIYMYVNSVQNPNRSKGSGSIQLLDIVLHHIIYAWCLA